MNNLQERLHASFFFYLFTGPDHFLVIGKYLTAAVLIGIYLELEGLWTWVASGWKFDVGTKKWGRVPRPVLGTLAIMTGTHLAGLFYFLALSSTSLSVSVVRTRHFFWPTLLFPDAHIDNYVQANVIGLVLSSFLTALLVIVTRRTTLLNRPLISSLLRALTLCIGGTIVCVTSVLNFSLAAIMALGLTWALQSMLAPPSTSSSLPSPRSRQGTKVLKIVGISLTTPPILVLFANMVFGTERTYAIVEESVWGWRVLGVWSLPLVCCVYYPFTMQAVISVLL